MTSRTSTPLSVTAHEAASLPAAVSRVGPAAACHVSALAVWNRRYRSGGRRVGRPASRGRPKLVAGVAIGPDRLWRLAVPVPVFVRRQPAPDQPGLADRGRSGEAD